MGVISTRKSRLKGDLTVVPTFRSANITRVSNLQEIVHAGTLGGRQRFLGVKDWNGTYEEYGLVPTFWPGDKVTWYGSLDGTAGWSGDALVTQTVITIPVGTKAPPTIAGTFRGVAALSCSDETAVDLPSASEIPETEGLCVQLQALAGGAYVNQDGTNEITITLSVEAKEFHHCGSSGIMDANEGLWDAQISYKRYVDDLTALPTEGDPYRVRVPIDAVGTSYYQFEFMRVGDMSDILLSRETGELLNVTIPLFMSMIELVDAVATRGSGVTKPAGAVWRPDED